MRSAPDGVVLNPEADPACRVGRSAINSGERSEAIGGEWKLTENSFLSLYDAAKDSCTDPPPEA